MLFCTSRFLNHSFDATNEASGHKKTSGLREGVHASQFTAQEMRRELLYPPPRRRFDGTGHGCYDPTAGWSSLVARWAHNPKVGGSNPPPATKPSAIPFLQVSGIVKVASRAVCMAFLVWSREI